jgi:hypothetical protein
MKKIICLAAMLMAAVGMQAQEESKSQWAVKPMVGATYSKIVYSAEDTKYKFGLAIGSEVLFQPKKLHGVSFSSGLLYTMQGMKEDPYNINASLDYLNVPLMVNYEIVKGLKLKAGVQLGYLLNAKASGESYGFHVELDVKSAMKPLYFSVPVGVSYNLPFGLVADFRYNFGITDVERSQGTVNGVSFLNMGSKGHHSTFMLTLGYQIDL